MEHRILAITRDDVLSALSTVAVDDGATTLPGSGRLSQVVIDGGNRVMFSISIDPSEAERFEPVRREAEGRVLAIPGVSSVLASLTSERGPNTPGPGAPRSPGPAPVPPRQGNSLPGVRHIAGSPSVCSTPTSTAPPCRSFWACRASRG